jgi:micrococcal nuclease
MVREGLAWSYRDYPPHDAELARLEAEARAAKRGLWGQLDPVPPWDWRRGEGCRTRSEVGSLQNHVYTQADLPERRADGREELG